MFGLNVALFNSVNKNGKKTCSNTFSCEKHMMELQMPGEKCTIAALLKPLYQFQCANVVCIL